MALKNVLIIGSGGREHALAWKLAQSKKIRKIFVAPGNVGTGIIAENVPINSNDVEALVKFARLNDISLTIVGPDNVLALGVVDAFQRESLAIFGPTKLAAKIEWSKSFAKKLMVKYGIPTAEFSVFSKQSEALEYLDKAIYPLVIKADGLASGKGVIICAKKKQAIDALQNAFLVPGKKVLIEQFLEGTEVSAHALCNGTNFVLFPLAQDHKRVFEGNTGPNTGGMGTICPVPEPSKQISEIVFRTLYALKAEGIHFSGCLFPGIILTKSGPMVLEFNARFGDPETQVYMRLLENDLLEILEAVVNNDFNKITLAWRSAAAICVVLASKGYPTAYSGGVEIVGIEKITDDNVEIFHAGTLLNNNKIFTAGGRVLNITATGITLSSAANLAYQACDKILFTGKMYRKDIGKQYIAG